MDLSKLTKGDQIVGGGSLVYLINMFLPWFKFKVPILDSSVSANGFDVGALATIPFLVSLGLVVWIVLKRFTDVKVPDEIPPLFLAGGVVMLFPVLKLLVGESSFSRSIGVILGALLGAAIAFGCYLKFLEAGGKMDELKGQMSALGDKAKEATENAKKSGENK